MKVQREVIARANSNKPRRAIMEGYALYPVDGIYPVADRVNLPGMLGEPDAWTSDAVVDSPYQQDSILVRR